MHEVTVMSALSFSLPQFRPSCNKFWAPPVQNLYPAPSQMCLTASQGPKQHWRTEACRPVVVHWLSSWWWFYQRKKKTWYPAWYILKLFALNKLICQWFYCILASVFIILCLKFLFPLFTLILAFDLHHAVWSPITMSSRAVIYSPIKISPLVWLWDQGGYSSLKL